MEIQVPDHIIKSFDFVAAEYNITTDEIIQKALEVFYLIGFLSGEDQETIMEIIDNGD